MPDHSEETPAQQGPAHANGQALTAPPTSYHWSDVDVAPTQPDLSYHWSDVEEAPAAPAGPPPVA